MQRGLPDWPDFVVRMDTDKIDRLVDSSEEQFLYRSSRTFRPYWILLIAAIAGWFGGSLASSTLWQSRAIIATWAVALALYVLAAHVLTGSIFGSTMRRRSVATIGWGVLLGFVGQLPARIDTSWVLTLASIGLGSLIGHLYGSLGTPWLRNNYPHWPVISALLATAITGCVTYVARDQSLVWVGMAGAWTSVAFHAGVMMILPHHWNAACGLRDLAKVYFHNDTTVAKGIAHLDEAIRLRPRDAELFNLRGIGWSLAGDAERAERDFQTVRTLAPDEVAPLVNLGLDQMKRGDFDAAIQSFQAAIHVDPRNALAHGNLGAAFGLRGEPEAAIEHFDKAITLQRRLPRAFSNRAHAWLILGELDRALADSHEALRLNPRSSNALIYRGQAYAELGRPELAEADFRLALSLDDEAGSHAEARHGLEALGVAPE